MDDVFETQTFQTHGRARASLRFVMGWILVCTLHAGMDEPQGATTPGQPRQTLPRAEDVLPAGEVSKGSLVVTGDGYRFPATA
jgi:hypothetical protein